MARKLLTPVQYESVLGGLNKARPLSLSDEGRVILSSPVLNANPVSDKKSVQGKLLRSNSGSSPKFNPKVYTSYQHEHFDGVPGPEQPLVYNFDPLVEAVLLNIVQLSATCYVRWKNSIYGVILVQYSTVGGHWIPFMGNNLFLTVFYAGAGQVEFDLYGFYGKDI